ncbi:hypothetical protein C7M84_022057 [Penaeus vannamei]|uniref:Uncharacterized protein n=1 Tax=Penaeus vannamei TaxID=6689 RepID=A0A423U7T6_PENVA|nr:hypothetical protein C7M84_022057 [Penaeus vannamei]
MTHIVLPSIGCFRDQREVMPSRFRSHSPRLLRPAPDPRRYNFSWNERKIVNNDLRYLEDLDIYVATPFPRLLPTDSPAVCTPSLSPRRQRRPQGRGRSDPLLLLKESPARGRLGVPEVVGGGPRDGTDAVGRRGPVERAVPEAAESEPEGVQLGEVGEAGEPKAESSQPPEAEPQAQSAQSSQSAEAAQPEQREAAGARESGQTQTPESLQSQAESPEADRVAVVAAADPVGGALVVGGHGRRAHLGHGDHERQGQRRARSAAAAPKISRRRHRESGASTRTRNSSADALGSSGSFSCARCSSAFCSSCVPSSFLRRVFGSCGHEKRGRRSRPYSLPLALSPFSLLLRLPSHFSPHVNSSFDFPTSSPLRLTSPLSPTLLTFPSYSPTLSTLPSSPCSLRSSPLAPLSPPPIPPALLFRLLFRPRLLSLPSSLVPSLLTSVSSLSPLLSSLFPPLFSFLFSSTPFPFLLPFPPSPDLSPSYHPPPLPSSSTPSSSLHLPPLPSSLLPPQTP